MCIALESTIVWRANGTPSGGCCQCKISASCHITDMNLWQEDAVKTSRSQLPLI